MFGEMCVMLRMHYVQCALWTQRVFGAVSQCDSCTRSFWSFSCVSVSSFISIGFVIHSFWRLSFWSQIFLWCNTMGWLTVGRFRQFHQNGGNKRIRIEWKGAWFSLLCLDVLDIGRWAHIYCASESHTMRQRCCETCSLWFVCCLTSDVCEWRRKRMCINRTYILKGEASAVYKFMNYYFVASPYASVNELWTMVPFERILIREWPKLWFCVNFDIDHRILRRPLIIIMDEINLRVLFQRFRCQHYHFHCNQFVPILRYAYIYCYFYTLKRPHREHRTVLVVCV